MTATIEGESSVADGIARRTLEFWIQLFFQPVAASFYFFHIFVVFWYVILEQFMLGNSSGNLQILSC